MVPFSEACNLLILKGRVTVISAFSGVLGLPPVADFALVIAESRPVSLVSQWTSAAQAEGIAPVSQAMVGPRLFAGEKPEQPRAVSEPSLIRLFAMRLRAKLLRATIQLVAAPSAFARSKKMALQTKHRAVVAAHAGNLQPSVAPNIEPARFAVAPRAAAAAGRDFPKRRPVDYCGAH